MVKFQSSCLNFNTWVPNLHGPHQPPSSSRHLLLIWVPAGPVSSGWCAQHGVKRIAVKSRPKCSSRISDNKCWAMRWLKHFLELKFWYNNGGKKCYTLCWDNSRIFSNITNVIYILYVMNWQLVYCFRPEIVGIGSSSPALSGDRKWMD